MRVLLSQIVFDAGTQIRAAINEGVVAEYADRMTEGAAFPPVVLFHDGNQYYMADGFHRGMAALRNQFRDIDAEIQPGTKTDALWFALGANKANGQRLSEADKRSAIKLALQTWPDRSATQIADQIGCTDAYVGRVRAEVHTSMNLPDRVTGKDGKSYPASHSVAPIEESKRMMPDRSPAASAQRRKDISDMAARGFTTRQIAAILTVSEQGIAEIAKKSGIIIHADRVVGKPKRHDPNRIIDQMSMDAENLTADVNLIEFGDIDRARLDGWIASFVSSHKSLAAFIRRLKQEQKNVEAA